MRTRLAQAVLALAVGILMMAAPGVAGATTDGEAAGPVSLPAGLQVGGMKVLGVEQSGSTTTLTLAPEDANRAAAVVTCTVYHYGPISNDNRSIYFDTGVFCDGVVDRLIIEVGMVMKLPGQGFFAVPGSYNRCDLLADTYLTCPSNSSCYFAEFYVGVSHVQAFLDQSSAALSGQTAPRQIACAV